MSHDAICVRLGELSGTTILTHDMLNLRPDLSSLLSSSSSADVFIPFRVRVEKLDKKVLERARQTPLPSSTQAPSASSSSNSSLSLPSSLSAQSHSSNSLSQFSSLDRNELRQVLTRLTDGNYGNRTSDRGYDDTIEGSRNRNGLTVGDDDAIPIDGPLDADDLVLTSFNLGGQVTKADGSASQGKGSLKGPNNRGPSYLQGNYLVTSSSRPNADTKAVTVTATTMPAVDATSTSSCGGRASIRPSLTTRQPQTIVPERTVYADETAMSIRCQELSEIIAKLETGKQVRLSAMASSSLDRSHLLLLKSEKVFMTYVLRCERNEKRPILASEQSQREKCKSSTQPTIQHQIQGDNPTQNGCYLVSEHVDREVGNRGGLSESKQDCVNQHVITDKSHENLFTVQIGSSHRDNDKLREAVSQQLAHAERESCYVAVGKYIQEIRSILGIPLEASLISSLNQDPIDSRIIAKAIEALVSGPTASLYAEHIKHHPITLTVLRAIKKMTLKQDQPPQPSSTVELMGPSSSISTTTKASVHVSLQTYPHAPTVGGHTQQSATLTTTSAPTHPQSNPLKEHLTISSINSSGEALSMDDNDHPNDKDNADDNDDDIEFRGVFPVSFGSVSRNEALISRTRLPLPIPSRLSMADLDRRLYDFLLPFSRLEGSRRAERWYGPGGLFESMSRETQNQLIPIHRRDTKAPIMHILRAWIRFLIFQHAYTRYASADEHTAFTIELHRAILARMSEIPTIQSGTTNLLSLEQLEPHLKPVSDALHPDQLLGPSGYIVPPTELLQYHASHPMDTDDSIIAFGPDVGLTTPGNTFWNSLVAYVNHLQQFPVVSTERIPLPSIAPTITLPPLQPLLAPSNNSRPTSKPTPPPFSRSSPDSVLSSSELATLEQCTFISTLTFPPSSLSITSSIPRH